MLRAGLTLRKVTNHLQEWPVLITHTDMDLFTAAPWPDLMLRRREANKPLSSTCYRMNAFTERWVRAPANLCHNSTVLWCWGHSKLLSPQVKEGSCSEGAFRHTDCSSELLRQLPRDSGHIDALSHILSGFSSSPGSQVVQPVMA